jgi:hypothetical protein
MSTYIMYSLDIINMAIIAYNKGIKIKVNNTNYTTFHNWFCKYNEFFITNMSMMKKNLKILTHNIYINQIKDLNMLIQHVNNNNGCSLEDIKNIVTNNNLSYSSICRVLKDNNITRKKIINKIVCKDIDKILKEREDYKAFINESYYNFISIDESTNKKC